jgi:hypothetical protein
LDEHRVRALTRPIHRNGLGTGSVIVVDIEAWVVRRVIGLPPVGRRIGEVAVTIRVILAFRRKQVEVEIDRSVPGQLDLEILPGEHLDRDRGGVFGGIPGLVGDRKRKAVHTERGRRKARLRIRIPVEVD